MQKWEYKVVGEYIDDLNQLGAEGWELVSVVIHFEENRRGQSGGRRDHEWIYHFKRPLVLTAPPQHAPGGSDWP